MVSGTYLRRWMTCENYSGINQLEVELVSSTVVRLQTKKVPSTFSAALSEPSKSTLQYLSLAIGSWSAANAGGNVLEIEPWCFEEEFVYLPSHPPRHVNGTAILHL